MDDKSEKTMLILRRTDVDGNIISEKEYATFTVITCDGIETATDGKKDVGFKNGSNYCIGHPPY